jgi:hypothetical protein
MDRNLVSFAISNLGLIGQISADSGTVFNVMMRSADGLHFAAGSQELEL